MPGTIYLVATPIGNLEDITLRALRILREADLVACEDTRHTRKLLAHYQIHKPLVSYHEHNEAEQAEELVKKAAAGGRIAVVSDAGMPGISDPGYRVVQRAIERGVPVVPVPGPVAAEAALAVSGLPCEAFRFGGFLPSKPGARRKLLQSLAGETATLVFYEAPHRIQAALEDIVEVLGSRPVVVARELTKVHEEFLRGSADSILDELRRRPPVKGEITLLVGRGETPAAPQAPLGRRIEQLMEEQKLDRMTALKTAARERGLSKREAYRLWQHGEEE
ncbi:MAG: 16S rRNA (cytidine(1402)-2'-O)-methyltransferase [Acidobacteria bacterium]|nr:16S rRNA (cytidine(1402)-2'-O)-methyltransferase [Acidobacteriota bacterium]